MHLKEAAACSRLPRHLLKYSFNKHRVTDSAVVRRQPRYLPSINSHWHGVIMRVLSVKRDTVLPGSAATEGWLGGKLTDSCLADVGSIPVSKSYNIIDIKMG